MAQRRGEKVIKMGEAKRKKKLDPNLGQNFASSLEGVMHFVLPSLQIVLALRQRKQQDENKLEFLLDAHNPLLIAEIAQPKQNCARLPSCEVAIQTPSLLGAVSPLPIEFPHLLDH